MEHLSYARTLAAQPENVALQRARKVCMHVMGPARTDGRAMRAATALAQAGMRVSIVDLEQDSSRPREEELDGVCTRHITMPGRFVPIHSKPWFLVKDVSILARLLTRGVIQLLKTPADIYHACDLKALPACYIAARLRRKPLIFETYELPPDEYAITHRRWLYALVVRVLRAMMPYCAGVITVSPPLVRELQQRYGGKTAVLVRNIPTYQVPRSSERLRRYLGLGAETRIALYQGHLNAGRGLDGLVYAAKYLAPGIVIVMLGRGNGQAELEALIAHEGVSDRVKIVPAVPYAELLEWTASADIGLVVPSPASSANVKVLLPNKLFWYTNPVPRGYTAENVKVLLPNKLFEYLMAGVPVLASPLEAIVDIIESYDVGCIVPSLEPAGLGHAISAMLADRAMLERMRHNALAASARELRWDIEQQRLLTLYQEVLGIHRESPAQTGIMKES